MTKVLADFHHSELFHSLQLLFEKRLGCQLFRPIGLEWYHEGYWNVYNHIDTARQFLDQKVIGGEWEKVKARHPNSRFEALNRNAEEIKPGEYVIPDISKDVLHRGVTLEAFKQTKFDILISSIPQHIQPFNKLIKLYQPQAKHIFQVGNAWGHLPGVKNILASTAPFSVPKGINTCFYHQEFNLDTFRYSPPTPDIRRIYSYVHWMQNKELFGQYAVALPEFQFHSFGAGMNSNITKTAKVADTIKLSTFTWQFKPEGDGFGHNVFNTLAIGRPILVWGSHYNGKLASRLLIDGKTCIDMEKRSFTENIKLIREYSKPDKHKEMCLAAHQRFKQIVDYDREEARIRIFLNNLR